MKRTDEDLPEGLKNLVLLCRDENAKIYLFDRLQKMPEPIQREIDKAMQLMVVMAETLDDLTKEAENIETAAASNEFWAEINQAAHLYQKFKEWKSEPANHT